jgi:hypothetical protein
LRKLEGRRPGNPAAYLRLLRFIPGIHAVPLLEKHVLTAPARPLAHHVVITARMVHVMRVMVHLYDLHYVFSWRLRDRERRRLHGWRDCDDDPEHEARSQ